MAKRRAPREAEERRPPVSGQQLDYLFAAALRDRVVFEQARFQITPDYFSEEEIWLKIVWTEACNYFIEYGRLPELGSLSAMVTAQIDDGMPLDDDSLDALNEFMAMAFDEDFDVQRDYAITLLKHFLHDRLSRMASQALSGNTPNNVCDVLSRLTDKASSINSLDAAGLAQPFSDGWDDNLEILERHTTGYSFLDQFMGGGASPGETIGLLGPYGGGKTTLGVMLSTAAAARNYRVWREGGRQGHPQRAYHFSYEEPIETLRIRALACFAQISRNRLEEIIKAKAYSQLSTSNNLREEERRRYSELIAQGQRPPGERERYEHAKVVLNACWRPVDMTPAPDSNGRGNGLVDEVASLIRHDLSLGSSGGASVVVLDYALAAIERYLQAVGQDRRELRHFVNRFPFEMKNKVARPFGAIAWTLHQLDTASNAMAAGHRVKLTSAAEGKAFPENCDFTFLIGKANSDGRAVLTCGKHRRTAPGQPDRVLRLDGELATFIDESMAYSVDLRRGAIISREDALSLTAFSPASLGQAPPAAPDADPPPATEPAEDNSGLPRGTRRLIPRSAASALAESNRDVGI